jgi:CheY-specific phosphatase CheX
VSNITPDRLVQMVTEALERTCFMVSDPSDADAVAANGYQCARCARIAYTGPAAGHVFVVASDGFLEELASSLLGCEPEEIDLEVEGRDAIKELANIMGGSVILELGGDNCEYRLGLPEEVGAAPAATGAECYIESTFGALRVCWAPEAAAAAKAA